LQPCADFFGLMKVLVTRAPEEKASGDSPDGDGDIKFFSDTKDAVFHGGETCAFWNAHAGCGGVERFDLVLESVIELGVYAGPSAHAAGFV
jgi:hypothetical protein